MILDGRIRRVIIISDPRPVRYADDVTHSQSVLRTLRSADRWSADGIRSRCDQWRTHSTALVQPDSFNLTRLAGLVQQDSFNRTHVGGTTKRKRSQKQRLTPLHYACYCGWVVLGAGQWTVRCEQSKFDPLIRTNFVFFLLFGWCNILTRLWWTVCHCSRWTIDMMR